MKKSLIKKSFYMVLVLNLATPMYAGANQNLSKTSSIVEKNNKDEIIIKYRYYNGEVQYRYWNNTKGCWETPYWISE